LPENNLPLLSRKVAQLYGQVVCPEERGNRPLTASGVSKDHPSPLIFSIAGLKFIHSPPAHHGVKNLWHHEYFAEKRTAFERVGGGGRADHQGRMMMEGGKDDPPWRLHGNSSVDRQWLGARMAIAWPRTL
jgi:hypothetical protein